MKKKLRRARKLIQASLDSHLPGVEDPDSVWSGGKAHHKRAIKEYREVLAILDEFEEYLDSGRVVPE